jgi:large subunit ribosomal protein L28
MISSLLRQTSRISALARNSAPAMVQLPPLVPSRLAGRSLLFPLQQQRDPQPQAHSSSIRWYRSGRARRGLYDGKDVRAGNNVSFSMRHTKRKFRPNVFIKRVYSEILDSMIPFHMTAAALRTIDKYGGLDNYLLKKEFKMGEGHKVKRKILQRLRNRAYFARRAARHEQEEGGVGATHGGGGGGDENTAGNTEEEAADPTGSQKETRSERSTSLKD